MLLELKRIDVPPGHKVLLTDVSWLEFETILEELGEHRAARIAYDRGTLEIMTPLPEHEVDKVFIGDFIKALLEEMDIEFYPLGSTTFKNELMKQGIEPDDCFYIENEAAVRGKDRLDLTIDPPPDLALEIDVTSRTHPNIYAALGVGELWRFEKGKLQINLLQSGQYVESEFSPHFPNFPLKEIIPEYLKRAKTEGRNKTMKAFRTWVKEQISNADVNQSLSIQPRRKINWNWFDLAICGQDGQLKLIVEVKINPEASLSLNWAAQIYHYMYASGMAKTPFFLLAHPQVFYLWKTSENASENLIEPTYQIDPKPLLKPYFEKSGVSPGKISESSFVMIVCSWFNEVLLGIKRENEVDFKNQDWLFESGLVDAIRGGQVINDERLC
ncbi:Uma2 family endonuclease [Limnoraphis robusta]|uniref:Uma2 family endonuclease n=1 Tax=Limnoraphis robusta TaxID=1118279 RepID=UPI0009E64199